MTIISVIQMFVYCMGFGILMGAIYALLLFWWRI